MTLQVFVSAIYLALLLPGVVAYRFGVHGSTDAWAWLISVILMAFTSAPLGWVDVPMAQRAMRFIVGSACDYFPVTVKIGA